MSKIVEDVFRAIVEGDDEQAQVKAEQAIREGLTAQDVLNLAIVPGIEEAGRLWKANKYFMPDVILSAMAFKAALDAVHPHLKGKSTRSVGRVMLGVVSGDMHDLGKTILIAMLTSAGFEVIDLGVDVPTRTIIDQARALKPDIIGLGAYMTTTMLLIKDVIAGLEKAGLRSQSKIMIGGVPTSQAFADEIGADAWGKDAIEAASKARQLMGVR